MINLFNSLYGIFTVVSLSLLMRVSLTSFFILILVVLYVIVLVNKKFHASLVRIDHQFDLIEVVILQVVHLVTAASLEVDLRFSFGL